MIEDHGFLNNLSLMNFEQNGSYDQKMLFTQILQSLYNFISTLAARRSNIAAVLTVYVPLSAMKEPNQYIVELESTLFVEWLELEFCQDLINSKICMLVGDYTHKNMFFAQY